MNLPIAMPRERLPELIDMARAALMAARDSAEVLDARDMARVAYDAAASAARVARAKEAHDTVLSQIYEAKASALRIEALAKIRLADEYDAAQDPARRKGGRPKTVPDQNGFSAANVGLSRKEIHEARAMRDAERERPGLAERAMQGMLERGEEPTKAKLRREMQPAAPAPKRMDPKALWVWGRLKDFERDGILSADPAHLLNEMTEPMKDDTRRLLPLVRAFLAELEAS